MEGLESLFGFASPDAMAVVGAALTLAIALRSLLAAVVHVLYSIDMAIDGQIDWPWVGNLGDWLDRVDGWLDRLPVKAPGVRGRGRP